MLGDSQAIPILFHHICLCVSYIKLRGFWRQRPTLIHLTLHPLKTFHNTEYSKLSLNIYGMRINLSKGIEADGWNAQPVWVQRGYNMRAHALPLYFHPLEQYPQYPKSIWDWNNLKIAAGRTECEYNLGGDLGNPWVCFNLQSQWCPVYLYYILL